MLKNSFQIFYCTVMNNTSYESGGHYCWIIKSWYIFLLEISWGSRNHETLSRPEPTNLRPRLIERDSRSRNIFYKLSFLITKFRFFSHHETIRIIRICRYFYKNEFWRKLHRIDLLFINSFVIFKKKSFTIFATKLFTFTYNLATSWTISIGKSFMLIILYNSSFDIFSKLN